MLVYICYYAYTNRVALTDNSYNGRQQLLLAQNSRGEIRAADGTVLAYTSNGQDKETRVYPFGRTFAHIVGYASHGRMGVESLSNYYLIHTSVDLHDKLEAELEGEKYPGDSVVTTLDVSLQEAAYEALSAYRGAVIATDPRTGRILAMVSKPDFDPNRIGEEWNEIISADGRNTCLLNRATQGLYPPGSTFKIITALEYLREHPEEVDSYHFNCTGHFSVGEDGIQCFHGQVHGQVDFASSFARSCNSSFANIGIGLDHASMAKTLQSLGFDRELPIDLPSSKSHAVCNELSTTADMMQLSIGQGTTGMSPLHLNLITCAIANGGELMRPYVVSSVVSEEGKEIVSYHPSGAGRLMRAEEAVALRTLMEGVVQNGTGKVLKEAAYTAAGKTGSAEFSSLTTDSHAWFTGYAPAEDPQICVTVIMENAGSGGEYAVPVAKRVLDAWYNESEAGEE
ncbi:MAG: penicillin-binding protein 2 [Butyrivibrio sp.]|nr:penicillin-binding protein 2 [Butyrivibrio sp.]